MKTPLYHLLLVFILCFFINVVYAQQGIFIGVKAGISIPNLKAGTDNPLSKGYATSLGADFGVLAEFGINKWLSIQPEIDYSQEGGKNDGLQPFINPYPDIAPQPYLYGYYKSEIRLDYLMVPVMAKFNFRISNRLKFYINTGVFGGFLLGARTITNGTSHVYMDPAGTQEQQLYPGTIFSFDDNEDVKDSLKTFNAGAILFIGFSYNIGRGKLFIESGGNYGFIGVQRNPDDGTNYAGAITAHIGYAYNLRRRRK